METQRRIAMQNPVATGQDSQALFKSCGLQRINLRNSASSPMWKTCPIDAYCGCAMTTSQVW